MKKVATIVSVALLFAVLLPGAAFAASSTCEAYNPQLCPVSTTPPPTTTTSSLPFTGLDVALLVAGGVMLMGAGYLVRVASRRLGD